jgi:CheY-like chemotaxis protein
MVIKEILVVDDEKDILESIKILIEGIGHKVITATSGKKALGKLKRKKFDLVLLDIRMPGLTGKETLEEIRKNPATKRQKVAFLTIVKPDKVTEKEIKKLDPEEYFLKPIDVDDFIERFEKII